MGNLAKLALQSPNTSLLKSLEVDSMALQMIADEFSTMIREDIAVYSFREERGMSGIYGLHDKVSKTPRTVEQPGLNAFADSGRLFLNYWRCS
jgi:hypothetical protein